MLLYYSKCRKNTESKHPKFERTKNGRIMLLSKCALCVKKCAVKNLNLSNSKKLVDH